MSTLIGTATDYLDLLDQLDSYLTTTGHAWGKTFVGTGDGDMVDYIGTSTSVAETFTITFTDATNFTVSGSTTGALAAGVADTPYTSAVIEFEITSGATPFAAGDIFTISTSPVWTRLRAAGSADQTKRTTDLTNVENMFDDGSAYASRAATSAYVEWEMHRATEVLEFILQCDTAATSPRDFALQHSPDGSTWTTAQSWIDETFSIDEQARIFTLTAPPGDHLYWRFEVTDANGSSLRIRELRLLEKSGDTYRLDEHAEFVWKGPGLDGTQDIYVGVETYGSSISDTFNLGFVGFRAWDDSAPVASQPNGCTPEYLSLVNSSIGFWFVVNGQRFMVVTKAAGIYQTAYCGFGLPYELPSIHEFPMIVGASGDSRTRRYNSTTTNYRHPMDPGEFGLRAFYPDAQWRNHANRVDQAGTEDSHSSTSNGKVWPAALNSSSAMPSFVRDNLDASNALLPGVIRHAASPVHMWGEFDGYYWTSGFGTVAEAIIRENGFDHLVVNNIYRTSVQHYAAVRLD